MLFSLQNKAISKWKLNTIKNINSLDFIIIKKLIAKDSSPKGYDLWGEKITSAVSIVYLLMWLHLLL